MIGSDLLGRVPVLKDSTIDHSSYGPIYRMFHEHLAKF